MWLHKNKNDSNEMVVNMNRCHTFKQHENEIYFYFDDTQTVLSIAMSQKYDSEERAAEVFDMLVSAISDGKNLFIMPTE